MVIENIAERPARTQTIDSTFAVSGASSPSAPLINLRECFGEHNP